MKTLVELFDKEPVENIYTAVAFRPERVIYIGDARLMTAERQENIRRFFGQEKLEAKLHFYSIRTDDVSQIQTVLEEITGRYDDCVCDVTGGTDLLLVSAGMLCARKKIPVLFFKVENLMALAGGSFIRHGHYSAELEDPQSREVIE